MIRIKRLLLKPNNNTQHAWKAPLSIASLALIATLSVGASNFEANADNATKKSPIVLAEEKIADARAEVMLKITDALLSGKMTPADAAKKMISFEEGVVEKMEYLRGIQQRIEHAVDSGKMTREEADAKYGAMLKDKKENSGNERANAYLKKVAGEIKEAVADGTLTSEEGKAKYAEAEARIEKRMAQKNADNKRLEAYLEKVGAEIKEAVANGTMTPEEGKAKYAETVEAVKQRMMGAKSKDKSKLITKEAYVEASAKMARMVKAGEITREDMQTRLDEMRMRMRESADRGTSKADKRARRARYQEASDKMLKMVEAGEITREQMQQRLDRMGRAMKESARGEERREISDDCMALRIRLGTAVRNGDMTREEAGKIWEEEGC